MDISGNKLLALPYLTYMQLNHNKYECHCCDMQVTHHIKKRLNWESFHIIHSHINHDPSTPLIHQPRSINPTHTSFAVRFNLTRFSHYPIYIPREHSLSGLEESNILYIKYNNKGLWS